MKSLERIATGVFLGLFWAGIGHFCGLVFEVGIVGGTILAAIISLEADRKDTTNR